jgi:glycosyltransferase involved in cell wall biosynthesis
MKVLVVTNMYPTQDSPAFGTFVQEQVEALRNAGVTIDVFYVYGKENKLNYLWGIFRFWAWLMTHRYNLIHAHYVFSGIIARMQFLYPVVLTHHGLEVFTGWQRFPSRMLSRFVNKTILVSQEQKEKLGNKKAVIIPCGIDFNLFSPMPRDEARKILNIPPSGKKLVLVLWAGDLSRPEKRFDIVKSAVALARERDPMVELLTVTGIPHNLIPLYVNAANVLLLVSDAEGSPMVIKEAMACNLPIVSTAVGDVPNVIKGVNGCYLCSQDPLDVAEKLLLAVDHPGGTNGREKIGHFEQGFVAKRILALYQEVINGEKRKGRVPIVSKA